MYMSQMWSSAGQRIMLGLTESTGKPVIYIWNEKSKLCARLTHSSLVILLFKLLLGSPESQSKEGLDSWLRTLFGMDAQSWQQFTQHMSSAIQDSIVYSQRTSADSLVQSKASSVPSPSDPTPSPPSEDSDDFEACLMELKRYPTTWRTLSVLGRMAGQFRAWDFPLTARMFMWYHSLILKVHSKASGKKYSDTSIPPSDDQGSNS